MTVRVASCGCGQLSAVCTGEPFRISVCHCLDCKKRSGSAFAAQARWNDADVEMRGAFREWSRLSDSGKRGTFRFCGTCGATVAYAIEAMPGVTAIPIGAFAEPDFPPPEYSVYEGRKHDWLAIVGEDIEHYD